MVQNRENSADSVRMDCKSFMPSLLAKEQPMRDSTKAAAVAGFVILAATTSSYAQSDQGRAAPAAEASPLARPYPLRIESSMSISIPPLSGADSEEQIKQLTKARGLLYQVAAQDCENIKQAFRADCKLLSVRVNSNIQARGPSAGEMMHVNASASYEVTIRPN